MEADTAAADEVMLVFNVAARDDLLAAITRTPVTEAGVELRRLLPR